MGDAILPVAQTAIVNARGEMRGSIMRFLRQATAIQANAIAKYYWTESPKEEWRIDRDFPSCVPFADRVWVEFAMPNTINSEGKISHHDNGGLSVAVLCEDGTRAFMDSDECKSGYTKITGKDIPSQMALDGLAAKLSVFCCDVLLVPRRAPPLPIGFVVYSIKREAGAFPISCGKDANGAPGDLFGVRSYPKGLNIDRDKATELIQGYSKVALLAFSFSACRNIVLSDVANHPLVGNRATRRSVPLAARIVEIRLNTDLHRNTKAPSNGDGETNPSDTQTEPIARHLVRGHFKTYSTDRPLFGSIVGTFWWSQQFRGDENVGIVEHVYQ